MHPDWAPCRGTQWLRNNVATLPPVQKCTSDFCMFLLCCLYVVRLFLHGTQEPQSPFPSLSSSHHVVLKESQLVISHQSTEDGAWRADSGICWASKDSCVIQTSHFPSLDHSFSQEGMGHEISKIPSNPLYQLAHPRPSILQVFWPREVK